jgi:hypothetical protein
MTMWWGRRSRRPLLVYLTQLFFQVSNQFLDALRGFRVRRYLPGELAVPCYFDFELNAFVFGLHGKLLPSSFLLDDGTVFLFAL